MGALAGEEFARARCADVVDSLQVRPQLSNGGVWAEVILGGIPQGQIGWDLREQLVAGGLLDKFEHHVRSEADIEQGGRGQVANGEVIFVILGQFVEEPPAKRTLWTAP